MRRGKNKQKQNDYLVFDVFDSILQTGFAKSPQAQAHCQPRVIVSGSDEFTLSSQSIVTHLFSRLLYSFFFLIYTTGSCPYCFFPTVNR